MLTFLTVLLCFTDMRVFLSLIVKKKKKNEMKDLICFLIKKSRLNVKIMNLWQQREHDNPSGLMVRS